MGRSPTPIYFPEPIPADLLDEPNLGNRFDSPTENYRVCYFATELAACYGETLSRFQPDPALVAAADEDGFMALGEVPRDWRIRRTAVRAEPLAGPRLPEVAFLDVEALATRRVLRRELARMLAYYGYDDLDVPTIRGRDRRITRWISRWAFDQRDDEGRARYAGVRYLSRLSSDWECWAVFEDVEIQELERRAILPTDEVLREVADEFGLTVF